ncbi:PfkB family carbohydrate kinase [Coralloluteibacterium stylophorae]|uniref:Ribokinase n=1 Tax=Coralloluteibacterium stylophorae TaxID=1776034 RepID=A0A8J7VY66_9GAMM|nr:bifunctional hydroxymethylpyrimidine kinase/phosphomethylpyrimidine kinase [Coralloluteibacterium stylophorae]
MDEPLILSLGSINADFQVRVEAALEPGQTLLASDFLRLSGGKAANRAFIARRLGVAAQLVGRVGDDDLAAQALDPLRTAGVDVDGVSVAVGSATAVSMIAVPPDGEKNIVLALNANDRWDDAAVRDLLDRIARAPRGSVLALDCEIPQEVVAQALDAAHEAGLRVVLDPSSATRVDTALLDRVYAITANPGEAGVVTGIAVESDADAVRAARTLADAGVRLACVKRTDGGCVFVCGGRVHAVGSPGVETVDSTGAGDAFAGALAVALLEGREDAEAVVFAVAAAALAATAYGSQPSYPDRDRIGALLPRLDVRTHAADSSA